MRLFIAIRPDRSMKEALAGIQKSMQRHGVRGNYPPAGNLHLTLAFIGDYPDPERVLDVLKDIAFEPFSLRLSGAGSFRGLWWAGLEENEDLKAIVKRLRRSLSDAGIPFDRKKFSPHITLVRKPVSLSGSIPEEVLRDLPAAEMTVDHISLMRSDRGKHGMIYTEI